MGLRVAELFAGVGGFRLGLQAAGHQVVWSNQWEPGKRSQWASDCYVARFGPEGHVNADIATIRTKDIPGHDLLVGGFPCQDYSVAATLDKSHGIQGRKGVLWWQIVRIVRAKRPSFLLLENVDRLLKSPARQRGRDFAIVLASLARLGYAVEWRVVNAADHGFPQKRRRVFIFAVHKNVQAFGRIREEACMPGFLERTGFFARTFPVVQQQVSLAVPRAPDFQLGAILAKVSATFEGRFENAGVMVERSVWTRRVVARTEAIAPLSSIMQKGVDARFYIQKGDLWRWKYLKGSKRERRVARNGHEYEYTEGAIPFPDALEAPSRTLLTSEGGTSPSRSSHIIRDGKKYRVLTPVECERLNGFPDGWTDGMPDRWRYFTMGNALVVGLVERMGMELLTWVEEKLPLLPAMA